MIIEFTNTSDPPPRALRSGSQPAAGQPPQSVTFIDCFRCRGRRPRRARAAEGEGVLHHRVNTAERADGCGDDAIAVLAVGDVGGDGDDIAAGGVDLLGAPPRGTTRCGADDDSGALAGVLHRELASTRARCRDHGDLVRAACTVPCRSLPGRWRLDELDGGCRRVVDVEAAEAGARDVDDRVGRCSPVAVTAALRRDIDHVDARCGLPT